MVSVNILYLEIYIFIFDIILYFLYLKYNKIFYKIKYKILYFKLYLKSNNI